MEPRGILPRGSRLPFSAFYGFQQYPRSRGCPIPLLPDGSEPGVCSRRWCGYHAGIEERTCSDAFPTDDVGGMSSRVSTARCSLRGYTPFETLSNAFDGVDSVHRAKRVVSVSPGTCRTHWSDWKKVKAFVPHLVEAFPMEEEGKSSFNHKLRLFYRYKNTPPIELLAETAYIGDPTAEDAKEVRWRSIGGFPHAGCVKFLPLENEQEGRTSVELEFTYRMPAVLVEFLGRHPIQADVDVLVQKSMDRFVQICEERET